jgi:hypothetical protein
MPLGDAIADATSIADAIADAIIIDTVLRSTEYGVTIPVLRTPSLYDYGEFRHPTTPPPTTSRLFQTSTKYCIFSLHSALCLHSDESAGERWTGLSLFQLSPESRVPSQPSLRYSPAWQCPITCLVFTDFSVHISHW